VQIGVIGGSSATPREAALAEDVAVASDPADAVAKAIRAAGGAQR